MILGNPEDSSVGTQEYSPGQDGWEGMFKEVRRKANRSVLKAYTRKFS
jgi:hypothetical protein